MIDPLRWRFERALARIEPVVEAVVADHATSYWGRPVRRHDLGFDQDRGDRRLVWTIEDVTVLDFRFVERGPATLVVHDFSLYEPLQQVLRTRHVRVRFATFRDT